MSLPVLILILLVACLAGRMFLRLARRLAQTAFNMLALLVVIYLAIVMFTRW